MDASFDRYLQGLTAGDADVVVGALAPDVVLHVAVHDEPVEGPEAARVVFGFLFDGIFSGLHVRDRIGDGDGTRAFVFDVAVEGLPTAAEGANFVRLDAEGRPVEVKVFLRPLRALNIVTRQMGKRFGGPPPE